MRIDQVRAPCESSCEDGLEDLVPNAAQRSADTDHGERGGRQQWPQRIVFGGTIAGAGCGKRSFVGLRGDTDTNDLGIFSVLAGNPGCQACAGTKHRHIRGKHVADEFLDARSASHCRQVLDEQ